MQKIKKGSKGKKQEDYGLLAELYAEGALLGANAPQKDDFFLLDDILSNLDSLQMLASKIIDIVGDVSPMKFSEVMAKIKKAGVPDDEKVESTVTILFLISIITRQPKELLDKMVLFASELKPLPKGFDKNSFDETKKLISPEQLMQTDAMSIPADIPESEQLEIFRSLEKRLEYMREEAIKICKSLDTKNIDEDKKSFYAANIGNNIGNMQSLAKNFESYMDETQKILLSGLVGITEHLCHLCFEVMYIKEAKKGVKEITRYYEKRDNTFGSKAERDKVFSKIEEELMETYRKNPSLKTYEEIYDHAYITNLHIFLRPGASGEYYKFETVRKKCTDPRKQ